MNKSIMLMLFGLALAVVALPWGAVHAGPGGGTYYANSPAGGVTGTALRKFVDRLPGLGAANANNLGQYIPIAQADTSTFQGCDYYHIGIVQYAEKMHSDLPRPTKLRGYQDLGWPALAKPTQPAHYLGPLIIARRDRPVRLLIENQLPTGDAGKLFIPVDLTLMGAGYGVNGPPELYTQNRTSTHLHGGVTPWISDGTPYQWMTPNTEATSYVTGPSFHNVPDMPAPPNGSQTMYYTNQQSARLMFYHEHAEGITRLGVYVGLAAGYLVTDAQEDDLITRGIIPGSTFPAEYKYGIPLIIQDKTYVPDNIATQDVLWTDPAWGAPGGDLWFPNVYETNQDPNSVDGANPFGRWDYGPWFWPPTAAPIGPLPTPSTTPEAFMDTPVINGTAYPYLEVERKAYRFRILNAANDRFWNLQLYYADPANPTEVRMVPATPGTGLPPGYPTDGRAGGVPNPAYAGPNMIQIGNEGGFIPYPYVVPNQPVNYDYDTRSITIGNVKEKALFLGPAERADVIIDFSQAPGGSTIIMYNDSPAPVPAIDNRLDYYTGNPDHTATGGAPSTVAGFGPNTRTIMQFRVLNTGSSPSFNLAALQNEATGLPAAYVASQPPPVIPQVDYPPAYRAATNTYSQIQFNSLTFTPVGGPAPQTIYFKPKAIQELFDPYGRMNATLGLELPFTNITIQDTIPLKYLDPPTEIIRFGERQIWKITHNGVDTHAVHVHYFNAQVINRVGWDNTIRPPDPNEIGWKETIRMNPLEDIIIAIRPERSYFPFSVPDSIRPLDPNSPLGTTAQFTGVNELGQPVTVTNVLYNFGWEYVWHCHLLGHEENDMMRPMKLIGTSVPEVPNFLLLD
jgi:FtsP/CotA-like multicopper oxidase with cupredoxin domain